MFLEIENEDGLNLNGFCEFLIPVIQDYAEDEANWDMAQVEKWNGELKTSELNWARDARDAPIIPSVSYIINAYFDNLQYAKMGGSYLITSNKNVLLNYTDISIDSLASRINDGILDFKGYSYFEDVFQHFADDLQHYYEIYLELGGDEEYEAEKEGEEEEETEEEDS